MATRDKTTDMIRQTSSGDLLAIEHLSCGYGDRPVLNGVNLTVKEGVTANIDWGCYKERITNVKVTAQEAREWVQKHGEKLHVILETALEDD